MGLKIDFVRNPILGSATGFLVIILKLIFTVSYEIKISDSHKSFTSSYTSFDQENYSQVKTVVAPGSEEVKKVFQNFAIIRKNLN